MRTNVKRAAVLVMFVGVMAARAETLKKGDAFPKVQGMTTGSVTLVDFWASWCAPCKASFPAMERIYEQFKEKGFHLVAISVDEDADAMQEFLDAHPVHFTVLHDKSHWLVSKVDVPAMPTSFLLDKNGRVVAIHEGFRKEETEAQVTKEIGELLEKSP